MKRSKPIESLIPTIRGQKVMLDADLAELYGAPTTVLNQAIKRNIERFPEDFLFRLTEKGKTEVVTNCDHFARLRSSPKLPVAFTEHGAIMAAMVLNSPQAVTMSVSVVRAARTLRSRDSLIIVDASPLALRQAGTRLRPAGASAVWLAGSCGQEIVRTALASLLIVHPHVFLGLKRRWARWCCHSRRFRVRPVRKKRAAAG